jgi:hypothetical protein
MRLDRYERRSDRYDSPGRPATGSASFASRNG